jgi:hypothetical protein
MSKTKLNTPPFRVSYPNVFKARRNDLNGKDEFSVVALFKKGEDLTKLKEAAQAAIIEKWGADKTKWPANLRSPFRDQGERAKNENGKEVLPAGYEKGAIFLNLKSSQRPAVVNQSVEKIIDEAEFYAGCYAMASVNAYAYDQKGNKGVSFGLGNIQKVKDGEPLGGRSTPEQDFAPIEVETTAAASGGTGAATDMFS